MAVDTSNNIYLGFDDFINSKIVKLSPTGTLLQTINQQRVQVISSISIDNLGNIYAACSCGDANSTFAGVSQPTSLSYSIYAVKYSASGVHQWTKYLNDNSCRDPQISAKTADNIYLSSSLTGAYTFGSFTTQGPSSGSSDDVFITKMDALGNFNWVKEVPDTGKAYIGSRNFLNSDSNGNVYFVGSTKGTTNWTPNATTSVSGNSTDALILKYNTNAIIYNNE